MGRPACPCLWGTEEHRGSPTLYLCCAFCPASVLFLWLDPFWRTYMGSHSVQGIALRLPPQESSIIGRINGQHGFWPALQPQLVIFTHSFDPMVPWGVTPRSAPSHPELQCCRRATRCRSISAPLSALPKQLRLVRGPDSIAQIRLHLTWPALVGSNEVLVCAWARVWPKDLAVHRELAPLLVLTLSQQLLESKVEQTRRWVRSPEAVLTTSVPPPTSDRKLLPPQRCPTAAPTPSCSPPAPHVGSCTHTELRASTVTVHCNTALCNTRAPRCGSV